MNDTGRYAMKHIVLFVTEVCHVVADRLPNALWDRTSVHFGPVT